MTKYDRALTVSEVIELEERLKKFEQLNPDATPEMIVDEVARLEDIVRKLCFICGDPRAEGSEWCVEHTEPESD